jgi:hypothetical protein
LKNKKQAGGYQKMGQMQKKRLKTDSKRVSKLENFIEGKWFFFSKGDQLDLPKMGQIKFFKRWRNITGILCLAESFILRNQIWKNGLPTGWSTNNRTNIKNFKNRA